MVVTTLEITMSQCFLNGEFLPLAEAKISVLDRGFIFGDGVYEYVPIYGGKAYRLAEHLQRLTRTCQEIGLKNPYTDARWSEIVNQLAAMHGSHNQGIYWQVTRGVAKRDHSFPKDTEPTVFMMSNPLVSPTPEQVAQGVPAVTFPDVRWHRCDLKTISLMGNVLAKQYATEHNAAEVVMLRDGMVTEASTSNVFLVKNGEILSPPKDNLILPGITLCAVYDHAQALGLTLNVRPVTEAELWACDELWLSSSSKEVLAITSLDGKPVGTGQPGPVFKRMHASVRAEIEAMSHHV
jgi:D-alanine transaminase